MIPRTPEAVALVLLGTVVFGALLAVAAAALHGGFSRRPR